MLGNHTESGRVKMPDPKAPVPVSGRAAPLAPVTRRAQRERRARILAATRVAIAEDIEEDVTIRDVANRSNVSTQTIYNLIGNRAQLVEDAINEQIAYTAAHADGLNDYPNIFLAIADMRWMSIAQNPDYSRKLINACDGKYLFAYKRICERNARSLHRLLKRQYQGGSEDQAELEALAWQITTLVGSTALEWARGLYDLVELRHRFAFAYGAPLMDVADPREWDAIRDWIKHIRKASA